MFRSTDVIRRVLRPTVLAAVAIGSLLSFIASCGGGGLHPPPTLHVVTLSWTANRETAVNSPGGGYTVNITGQPPINVPYDSGAGSTPTSTQVSLWTGSYSVTVVAYSALNAPGSSIGSTSAPSAALTVNVP